MRSKYIWTSSSTQLMKWIILPRMSLKVGCPINIFNLAPIKIRGRTRWQRKRIDKDDDRVLKQLKRTQAYVSFQELLKVSKHKNALTKALPVLKVSTNATFKEVAKLLLFQQQDQIVFDNSILLVEGKNHNRPPFITTKVRRQRVLGVMIDHGHQCVLMEIPH